MAATMKDLAKRTGLGIATISSYFNGGNVREKNRIKIEEAIEELHYEVNEVARNLKRNATKTIGVVIPELNNIFCSEIITEMEDVLRNHGYATIICDCRTDKKLEKEAIEFLMYKRVDGIINMPVDTAGKNLQIVQKQRKPIVLLDRQIMDLQCDSVLVDNEAAAQKAVSYLIENGHSNIGIIGGPREVYTAQERMNGYVLAHKKHNLDIRESLIYHGDYTIKGGVNGVEELVQKNPDMTAIFVTNYEMTMGAVIGVNEMNIKIPEQISLIGFDNLQFARACSPKLTIVAQPTKSIAQEAAGLMLKRLGGNNGEEMAEAEPEYQTIRLQTSMIAGKSVINLK
ncbi:MAG: LacI family DNA-binding transcriptional regulator [Eubacteriales bacterium]|nr:LacI family DNA-binding transcriptional regulator [Eubacteriales bacterium]